jgi:hypothetical protein
MDGQRVTQQAGRRSTGISVQTCNCLHPAVAGLKLDVERGRDAQKQMTDLQSGTAWWRRNLVRFAYLNWWRHQAAGQQNRTWQQSRISRSRERRSASRQIEIIQAEAQVATTRTADRDRSGNRHR